MRGKALQKISEMEKRMLAFVTAMSYNYCQLCVKAEPSSLLTAEMFAQGDVKHIEDLAFVYVHNKDKDGDDISMDLYPKAKEFLPIIAQGMTQAHPEFKQEILTRDDAPEDDEEDYKYLRLTVPEINKDRRDAINSGIDAIHTLCKTNLDKMYVECTTGLVPVMVGYSPEEVDEVNKEKDKYRDTYKKMMEDLTNDKKKEVEDAYQEYLKNGGKTDDSSSQDNKNSSGGPQISQSIKM